MQNRLVIFIFVFSMHVLFAACQRQNDHTVLSGPYLGQKPPGTVPEIFAPGIICTDDHEGCAEFSPDGSVFLFHRLGKNDTNWVDIPAYIMEMENGEWGEKEPAPFESKWQDWDYHFSPDGKSFLFTSKRPVDGSDTEPDYGNIWKVDITSSGWSEPELLKYPINSPDHHDSGPSLTNDGTLYFFSNREGGFGKTDLYRSRLVNGEYRKVENLGATINSEQSDYDLFVAPDESFLIFSSTRPGGYGEVDLYVSFSDSSGMWKDPINLGEEINTGGAVFPSLTGDGKYLFFQSRRYGCGNIYWVDASVIESLKP